MARSKPTYTPNPRLFDIFQVACWFGKSEGWFRQHRSALEAQGFPHFDKFLGGWDADAMDRWLDARSGIHNVSAMTDADWIEALNGTD